MRSSVLPVAIILSLTCTASVGKADDFFLYEKSGLRINLAGNGGNCNVCEWLEISGQIPPDAGEVLQEYIASQI